MEPFRQQEFGWRVALDFLLSGSGSSLFIVYFLAGGGVSAVYMVGPALVLAGLAVLLSELGRPSNFWRSIYNYRASWMARGAIFNLAYTLIWLAMVSLYALRVGNYFPLYAVEFAFSFPVLIYPVMLLYEVKDIKLWRSWWTSALTLLYAISGGSSLGAALSLLYRSGDQIVYASALINVILIVFLFVYIQELRQKQRVYRSVESALREMLYGGGRALLQLSFSGAVVSLAMYVIALAIQPVALLAVPLGAAIDLAGVYSFRLMVLRLGFHEPLVSERRLREMAEGLRKRSGEPQ